MIILDELRVEMVGYRKEMEELDEMIRSKDEMTREFAKLQQNAIIFRLKKEGCVEWGAEL